MHSAIFIECKCLELLCTEAMQFILLETCFAFSFPEAVYSGIKPLKNNFLIK